MEGAIVRILRSWDGISIAHVSRKDAEFYSLLGPFFGSRQAARELGMPIYDDDNRLWVVAIAEGQPVGCASLEVRGRKGLLKSAWVRPEYRGRGIYTALVEERLQLAADSQLAELVATCTDAGARMLARYGFQESGRRGKYLVMSKGVRT